MTAHVAIAKFRIRRVIYERGTGRVVLMEPAEEFLLFGRKRYSWVSGEKVNTNSAQQLVRGIEVRASIKQYETGEEPAPETIYGGLPTAIPVKLRCYEMEAHSLGTRAVRRTCTHFLNILCDESYAKADLLVPLLPEQFTHLVRPGRFGLDLEVTPQTPSACF